jgi:hypothetical protein
MSGSPTTAEIRSRFRETVGDQAYRRFVSNLTGAAPIIRRLRYADEQRWCAFLASNPELGLEANDAVQILWVCPIHDEELVRQTQSVAWQVVRMTDAYTDASEEFPFAARVVRSDPSNAAKLPMIVSTYHDWRIPSVGSASEMREGLQIEFCPSCLKLHNEWVESHPALASILIAPISLENYSSRACADPSVRSEWLRRRGAEVRDEGLETFELWEWNAGHDIGDAEGFGGLAVLREGKIVKVWVDRDGDGCWLPFHRDN